MGKHKYIETPDKLWEYFKEYKKETKKNPFLIKDWVGKDALDVYREKERPLTIEGFECWLFDNDIIGDLSHYFANTNNKYENYLTICLRVKKAVRQDQIEGGMAGVYNPSITQRLNGLVEKVQTDNKHEVKKFEVEIIDNNPDAESK
jgi:hypothetical protein